MSFFTEEQKSVGGNFEASTNMEPIPHGTNLKAMIEDAKNDDYEGERYINLRWTVLAPETYANRKVFQKVRVYDADPKKADKAKRMLVAVASNTGGGLLKIKGEPTDADLQTNLVNKPMVIKVGVWEMKEQNNSGNWVMAVSSVQNAVEEVPQSQAASQDSGDDVPW